MISVKYLSSLGNLDNFFKQVNDGNKNSILFKGESFSLQIQDQEKGLVEARNNKLPIVDFKECEDILKMKGIIGINQQIFALNMISSPSDIKNDTILQNKAVTTKIVDSNGKNVNITECNKFEVKNPINGNLVNISMYDDVKSRLGYNIFNSSDEMFEDICKPFPNVNNTDLTLGTRRKMFNSSVSCPPGTEFNGFDEHQYSKCTSSSPPKDSSVSFDKATFGPLLESNFRLIKCWDTFTSSNITENFAFYFFISICGIGLICNMLHLIFFKVEANVQNIFNQDAITVNPEKIGKIDIDNYIINNKKIVNQISNIETLKKIDSNYSNEKFMKNITVKKEENKYDVLSLNIDVTNKTNFNPSYFKNVGGNEDQLPELKSYNSNNIENISLNNSLNNNQNSENIANNNNFIINNSNNALSNYLGLKNENNNSHNKNFNDDFKNNINELRIEINTKNDLNHLPLPLVVKFDKRSFWKFLIDQIIDRVDILNIIITRSVLNPFYIRLNRFLLVTNLEFCLCAMFLTASLIEKQSKEKMSNADNKIGFFWMLYNQFAQNLYSTIIALIICNLLNLIIRVPLEYREQFNRKMIEDKEESKKEAM